MKKGGTPRTCRQNGKPLHTRMSRSSNPVSISLNCISHTEQDSNLRQQFWRLLCYPLHHRHELGTAQLYPDATFATAATTTCPTSWADLNRHTEPVSQHLLLGSLCCVFHVLNYSSMDNTLHISLYTLQPPAQYLCRRCPLVMQSPCYRLPRLTFQKAHDAD